MKNPIVVSENNLTYKSIMPAQYRPSPVPLYAGNPYVEALPDIHKPDFIKTLTHIPLIKDEVLQLPPHLRIHMVQPTLEECFTVTPQIIALEQSVSTMIRHGYSVRAKAGVRKPATGLPLCGIHGCGQKTALQKIVSTYPKLILHHEYQSEVMLGMQMPFLQVQLSSSSTLQSVFDSITDTVSELVGFSLCLELSIKNDGKSAAVTRLLRTMHTGLVIVQGLDQVRNRTHISAILGFFTSLISTESIPVVFVGDPDTAAIFGKSYTFGYPASSAKYVFNFLMDFDSNWITATRHLYSSMLLRDPMPFSDEIAVLLYQHSQGLIGIAKRILVEAEIHTLQSNKEAFSSDDLINAALAAIEKLAIQIDQMIEGSRLAAERLLDLARMHHEALVAASEGEESETDTTPRSISSDHAPENASSTDETTSFSGDTQ